MNQRLDLILRSSPLIFCHCYFPSISVPSFFNDFLRFSSCLAVQLAHPALLTHTQLSQKNTHTSITIMSLNQSELAITPTTLDTNSTTASDTINRSSSPH